MAEKLTEEQAKWRQEFEETGETQVRQNLLNHAIYNSEPKYRLALSWVREQEVARELRAQQTYSYTHRTFWAAVAAVIVSIIGIIATLRGLWCG